MHNEIRIIFYILLDFESDRPSIWSEVLVRGAEELLKNGNRNFKIEKSIIPPDISVIDRVFQHTFCMKNIKNEIIRIKQFW